VIFQHYEFLWLLLAIGLLFFLQIISLKFVRKRALKFSNYELMEKLSGEKILSRNYVTFTLRILTLAFIVFSLAGTTVRYTGYAVNSDFVLVIDASGSMLADDYEPDRLEAAKLAANAFIDSLPGNSRAGLVSFAGISFVKSIVTDDVTTLKRSVDSINVESVGGTAIGDAIVTASNLLAQSENPKNIILLTDGQSNVGISVEEAIAYANSEGIRIDTVGIGTEAGGSFDMTDFVSRPDTKTLGEIANQTGGIFQMADDSEELSTIYQEITRPKEQTVSFDASFHMLLLAFVFLFVEWVMTNTKFRVLP